MGYRKIYNNVIEQRLQKNYEIVYWQSHGSQKLDWSIMNCRLRVLWRDFRLHTPDKTVTRWVYFDESSYLPLVARIVIVAE